MSHSWEVHCLILSTHSGYLSRLCRSEFKEGEEGEVTLKDDPIVAVQLMIGYFYKLDYDPCDPAISKLPYGPDEEHNNTKWVWYQVHAWLLVIADKYEVQGLAALALRNLEANLCDAFIANTPAQTMHLLSADLIKATEYIYEHPPPNSDRVRQAIVHAFMHQRDRIVRFANKDDFEQLLAKIPEFAADYLRVVTGIRPGEGETTTSKTPKKTKEVTNPA